MNNHTLTPDQLAEQAGLVEMRSVLKAMQQTPTTNARIELFVEALCGIYETNNPWAVGGAAAAIFPFIDRGLSGGEV